MNQLKYITNIYYICEKLKKKCFQRKDQTFMYNV